MISGIDTLESTVSAAIARVDTTPFAFRGETFIETDLPLTESIADSALQAHLAFSVSVESAPARDDGHIGECDLVTVEPVLTVIFLYRLRPKQQRTDTRTGAIPAAKAVMRAVLQSDRLHGIGLPLNVYEPQAMIGEFLPVRQTYQFLIDV